MTCKQLWNPVDAWQGDVLIKCDAGRIQHDAVQSVISMKVQTKNPKVPPKNEQQVFCLLALLHLCRCQSTSQRAQAPLQQTHGNFGTCPAATSTAGTLKAPRRRGSGKAVPENIPQNPSRHQKDSPKSVKIINSTKYHTFKTKHMFDLRRVSWPRSVIIIVIIIISIIICAILLAEGGSQSQGIGSTLRQCHLRTCMMFGLGDI